MKVEAFFEKRSKSFWVITGLALVLVLGIIDHVSGYEISISLFYLFPIILVVWYVDRRMGWVLSFASAMAWVTADFSAGLTYSHPSIYIWNAVLRFGFYCVVAWLASALKRTVKSNQELARTDYVTGAVSIRHFYELAQKELVRSQRYGRPLTLVYIDLDNFKLINDRLGHSTGDRVLREVTEAIRRQIRPTDTLARLGGDEFALLMPETDDGAAKTFTARIHSSLVEEMLRNGWMITFSVGVVTCNEIPRSVDDMVKMADRAMYTVKTASKNGVSFLTYSG